MFYLVFIYCISVVRFLNKYVKRYNKLPFVCILFPYNIHTKKLYRIWVEYAKKLTDVLQNKVEAFYNKQILWTCIYAFENEESTFKSLISRRKKWQPFLQRRNVLCGGISQHQSLPFNREILPCVLSMVRLAVAFLFSPSLAALKLWQTCAHLAYTKWDKE